MLDCVECWSDNDNEGCLIPERDMSSPFPSGAGRAPRKDPPGRLSGDIK